MIFREINFEKDIEKISVLLNSSLEGDHSKKQIIWKHLNNPFGNSLGLVAEEGDIMVGVRLFMRWNLELNGTEVKALRPVDTATHPDFRGRGIFSKLTLHGLERFKNEYDFIFNTPNSNSLDGYLKMGWKHFNKPYVFKTALVFPIFKRAENIKIINTQRAVKLLKRKNQKNKFHTKVSERFLEWRYGEKIYHIAEIPVDNEMVCIIYKKSKLYKWNYLIIQEYFGNLNNFKKAIRILSANTRSIFVHYMKDIDNKFDFNFSIERDHSNVIFNEDKKNINNKLIFSLGDLEGRI